MPLIEQTITIQRPLFDVFREAGDFEQFKVWQRDVLDISLISGDPIRPGTMVSMTRRFGGRVLFINADVVDYQRNKAIELNGVWGRFPFRRRTEFSSAGGGQTQIHDTLNIRLPWFYFWYSPIFTPSVRRLVTSDWQTLKSKLESRA